MTNCFYFIGKLRHRDTHKFHTHKLGVRVDGWQEIDPVSVDRVGVYFRQASPDYKSAVSINICSICGTNVKIQSF